MRWVTINNTKTKEKTMSKSNETKLVILVDGEGVETDLGRSAFLSYMVEERKISGLPAMDENNEIIKGEEGFNPVDTCNLLLQLYDAGGEMDWSIPQFSSYEEHYTWMDELLAESEVILKKRVGDAAKEKEDKVAQDAADKEAKKAEEALVVSNRVTFLTASRKGSDKATDAFKEQLKSFGKSLPGGVAISQEGFGLVFKEDALTPEVLGETMGALVGADTNFDSMSKVIAWLLGDVMNAVKEKGLYGDSYMKCAKALSADYAERGLARHPRTFEKWGKMARDTCLADRNDNADPEAYIQVSQAGAPKKLPEEKHSDWQERVAAHKEDKDKIFEVLKAGEIAVPIGEEGKVTTVAVTTGMDAKKLVEQMQIKHGVKTVADPEQKSLVEWLTQFFEMSVVKDLYNDFANKDDAGSVIFQKKNELLTVSENNVATLIEEARANLENILLQVTVSKSDTYTIAQMMAGTRKVKRATMETVDGKTAPKKKDGKVVMHEEDAATYPPLLIRAKHGTPYEAPKEEAEVVEETADEPVAVA